MQPLLREPEVGIFGEDSLMEAACTEATGVADAGAAGASTSADLAALFPCKK